MPQVPPGDEPERFVFVNDRRSGLRAIVSIQSTVLGPALGGCRFRPYGSLADAATDALRLGRAMADKASLAGLDLGGGKGVIIGAAGSAGRAGLLHAFGDLVESLGGRYITAEDVGTSTADMDLIAEHTRHVVGRSVSKGGSGDPSPSTALGLVEAMRAAAAHVTGSPDLGGMHVVVSGVGKVGRRLVEDLVPTGVTLTVADVSTPPIEAIRRRFDVGVVEPGDAHRVECDIFSPCSLGGVLNEVTIPELRCRMVVGSANNQLAGEDDADRLVRAGIVYAPDFAVNAGGLIHVSSEVGIVGEHEVEGRVRAIGATTTAILAEAVSEGITPEAAAIRRARRRIEEALASQARPTDSHTAGR